MAHVPSIFEDKTASRVGQRGKKYIRIGDAAENAVKTGKGAIRHADERARGIPSYFLEGASIYFNSPYHVEELAIIEVNDQGRLILWQLSNKRQSKVVQRKDMKIFNTLKQFWIDAYSKYQALSLIFQ
ncbi:MAG: hypothetical protein U1C55_00285 [Smithellaceae bacterium]|nr:hypothetical protein [Smithellaceae bacterium]